MRILLLLIVLANLGVLAWGQGFFGTPPSDDGRAPRPFSQHNQNAVQVGAPQSVYSRS